MSRITRNLSIIFRAERAMAQRRLSILQRRTGLLALAGVVLCLGIVMLNIAAYLGLSWLMPRPAAALCVALANFAVAGLLALIAGRQDAEAATAPMAELRDMALEDVEAEVDELIADGRTAMSDIRRMARDPLGAVAPGLASAVIKAVSSSSEAKKDETDT